MIAAILEETCSDVSAAPCLSPPRTLANPWGPTSHHCITPQPQSYKNPWKYLFRENIASTMMQQVQVFLSNSTGKAVDNFSVDNFATSFSSKVLCCTMSEIRSPSFIHWIDGILITITPWSALKGSKPQLFAGGHRLYHELLAWSLKTKGCMQWYMSYKNNDLAYFAKGLQLTTVRCDTGLAASFQ